MLKDLKIVSRPSRTKPGMKDFFILILVYSYFNKNASDTNNEFSIPQSVLADYFKCTPLTIKRWCAKLRDIDCLKYAERDNAGKTIYYKDAKGTKVSYIIPKYKKIRVGQPNEIKFLNVYILDQKKLNQYMIDCIDLDILSNISNYKNTFNQFISFLTERSKNNKQLNLTIDTIDEIKEIPTNLSKENKEAIKRLVKLKNKIEQNKEYCEIKRSLDRDFPEFTCKYLEEGSLRLTHEICTTVNPEHTEKINENNYWRSSRARIDMLESMLQANILEITEYDVNGSIYRLTYNLNHDVLLPFDYDIYEKIWNNCNFSVSWSAKNKEKYRKKFKYILMPLYMKPSSIGYTISQWTYIDKYYANHPRKYQKLNNKDKEFYENLSIFTKGLNIDINTFLTTIRDSMYKTLNITKPLKSDIFTFESNLHILIRRQLLDRGIKCVNVYDGFYIIKNQLSKEEFSQVYNTCTEKLKENMKNVTKL